MNRRLYRSSTDRILAGVAGGMAATYDLDPALVRVGWAVLALLTGGAFLIVYLVMAIVVPPQPAGLTLWATAPGGTSAPSGPDLAGGPDQSPSPLSGINGRTQEHDRNGAAGAWVIGLILIAVGAFFLVRQFYPSINLGAIWPVIAIGGGLVLIVAAFVRQRPDT
jgi:phage shock protein C